MCKDVIRPERTSRACSGRSSFGNLPTTRNTERKCCCMANTSNIAHYDPFLAPMQGTLAVAVRPKGLNHSVPVGRLMMPRCSRQRITMHLLSNILTILNSHLQAVASFVFPSSALISLAFSGVQSPPSFARMWYKITRQSGFRARGCFSTYDIGRVGSTDCRIMFCKEHQPQWANWSEETYQSPQCYNLQAKLYSPASCEGRLHKSLSTRWCNRNHRLI